MTDLQTLANVLQGEMSGKNVTYNMVSTDTRTLQPGDLFVALTGPNFDGHDFIATAKEKNAAAALVSKQIPSEIPILHVEDTRKALGKMAKFHRNQFDLPIVAITGSCGKTTTKTMVSSILSQKASTLSALKSLNNDIGVPLTLLRLTPEHKYAVIEMGANHPGEIHYLTHIARPFVAMVNNVAPAHLEGFGSVKGVASAKSEIFEGLVDGGYAVINADDEYASFMHDRARGNNIITYGIQNPADIYARNVLLDESGYPNFTLIRGNEKIEVTLTVLGEHNVMNALAAAAVSTALGLDLQTIKSGLENMEPVDMRLIRREGKNGSVIFDDTYNANPLSFDAALRVLARNKGDKILVIGDMGELGSNADKYHQEIGLKAKNLGINKLYAVGNFTRLAVEAFGTRARHFTSHEFLITALLDSLAPGVAVLVKGSRKAQMETVVKAIKA